MSAAKPPRRPKLKDARRQFWWCEADSIDHGIPAHIGVSAWAVYTCLLRHLNDTTEESFPATDLLMAETGLSNRVIAQSLKRLEAALLVEVKRENHQHNTYYVLDVQVAVRKQGWPKVTESVKKARDEKSHARTKQQVTKTTKACDEKSPEHVTNSHTNQINFNQTKKSGVSNVTSNAPAPAGLGGRGTPDGEVVTMARQEGIAPLTTFLEMASTALQLMPPQTVDLLEGPAAAPSLDAFTDEDLDELFTPENVDDQSPEKVPGAAAGGGRAAAPAADALPRPKTASNPFTVTALAPIPQDVLLSRPVDAPTGESYKKMLQMVGGNKAIDAGLLEQPTPSGALDRKNWLRLTVPEMDTALQVAKQEAQVTKTSFITLAIRALDRLIGAPSGQSKTGDVVALPTAYLTQQEKDAVRAELPDVTEGSRWESRKSGKIYTVAANYEQTVEIEGLGELPMQRFLAEFKAVRL